MASPPQSARLGPEVTPEDVAHVRPIRPLHFPASDPEWEMSESHRHKRLCELLYQLLRSTLGVEEASVGADQFVYFDASNPKRKCAPDGFVKLRVPAESIEVWKTWEKGAPELCVEILSPSDTKEKLTLPQKLQRFHTMGVKEVIAFDADAPVGARLRAWDLMHGDLVERAVEGERTRCFTLGAGARGGPMWFVVAPYEAEGRASVDRLDAALRLAEGALDAPTLLLVPTPDEVERALLVKERARAEEAERQREEARAHAGEERARAEEAERQREEARAHAVEERARAEEAERRAAEAEAELARLRGSRP